MEATSAPRPHALRVPRPRRWLAALSDERLVGLVRDGDAGAFEVLYDRHSAGILGFCRHMLTSVPDAEDAVQHTFIAAHSDIQRHGERDLHVKAWLYAIARNRCLSMLRARREQPAHDEIEIVTDNFQHDLQQRDDLRALLADVHKLPDDQREALVLAEVGDLSHEDISSVIGCEANKVKSLVFQARTALIDRRIARETPCEQIREEIATLRGGALRRSYLRHHLDVCPGCTEYRDDVRRQRAMLALALPVVPSAALKANVLGGLGLGGGGATVAAVGGGAGAGGLGLGFVTQAGVVAKLGLAALIAASIGGGVSEVTGHGIPLVHHAKASDTKGSGSSSSGGGASKHAAGAGSSVTATQASHHSSHSTTTHSRSASGTEHGFTPAKHGSSGAAARERAATRGKGKHLGITKTHHTPTRAHGAPVPKKTHVKHVAAPRANSHASPNANVHRVTPTPKAPTTKPAPTKTQPTPAPQGNANGQTQSTTTAPAPQSNTTGPGSGLGKALGGDKRSSSTTG